MERWGYALRPVELSAAERRRAAGWAVQEVGWRALRRTGLWRRIAPLFGRAADWN
jgi:hypothetical protein